MSKSRDSGYRYADLRETIFTDAGQRMFLQIRDRVHKLLKQSGCVRMQEAIAGSTGDSWLMLACVDRMVELDEIREINYGGDDTPGQLRLFVANWQREER